MTFSRLMEVSVLLPSVKSLPFSFGFKVRFVSVPACTSDRPDIVYLPAPSTVMFLLNLTSSVTSDSKVIVSPSFEFSTAAFKVSYFVPLISATLFPVGSAARATVGNKHAATNLSLIHIWLTANMWISVLT